MTSRFCRPGVFGDGKYGPEFDHLTLKVKTAEGVFLADVGFGTNFLTPLRFEFNTVQSQRNGDYRLVPIDGAIEMFHRPPDEAEWKPQYRFYDQPRNFHEFGGMCCYQQYSPTSNFMKKRVCTLLTKDGRITLANDTLIETVGAIRTETGLENETAVRVVLADQFGVRLNANPKSNAKPKRV